MQRRPGPRKPALPGKSGSGIGTGEPPHAGGNGASAGDAVHQEVGLEELAALRRADLVTARQYLDAAYLCRDGVYWSRWALRALLALGAGHLLAGIVFFFAFNWQSLPLAGKFAIIESGVAACAVLALAVGIRRAGGQVLLIGASVLAGTLLAVIGQVYQTGADAYQLFALWAFVIVPWVVASRSAAHWLVWLVIAYLAADLYAYQVLLPRETVTIVQVNSVLALTLCAVLALREWRVRAGGDWLGAHWTRLTLVFFTLLLVFAHAVVYVFGATSEWIGAIGFAMIVAAFAMTYVRLLPDFAAVAVTTGFVALLIMAIGGRVLQETVQFDADSTFRLLTSLTLLTLWCAAVTTGTLKFLNALRDKLQEVQQND